ncbi:phage holin family protein [Endozoicomonas sp.]|uniref:phage holin family protein n=1 Tax=Endozoicomonas sp. TaxID=1892382 RepID=UPI002887B8BA|nr:phage holin family protein [Endozoicomonas sp.]
MEILLFLLFQILIFALYGFIIFISARLLPGIEIKGYQHAVIVALVLTFLNLLVKPILLILTFPITVITLGLFTWVINALILVFASKLVDGFAIKNFGWAMLMSLVMGIFKILAVFSFPYMTFY